jgi:1-phosphatidylinositol-3-phosphate 5-kinase
MDYSLLVGLNNDNDEIIIGIIDYIRTYTIDKSFETWYKNYSPVVGNNKELPTIVMPQIYKNRFREAMLRYFLLSPSKFIGLLKINK